MVPSTGADWPADLSTRAAAANSYSVHPPQGLDLLHDALEEWVALLQAGELLGRLITH